MGPYEFICSKFWIPKTLIKYYRVYKGDNRISKILRYFKETNQALNCYLIKTIKIGQKTEGYYWPHNELQGILSIPPL